jgi:hypothetical protein
MLMLRLRLMLMDALTLISFDSLLWSAAMADDDDGVGRRRWLQQAAGGSAAGVRRR